MPIFDPASLQRQVEAIPIEEPRSLYQVMTPKSPESSDEALWPYLALVGGQGADIATTLMANRQGLQEGNPLGVGGVLAAKAAYTATVGYLMHKLHDSGHDKAAKTLGVVGGVTGAVPAAWNVAQLRK